MCFYLIRIWYLGMIVNCVGSKENVSYASQDFSVIAIHPFRGYEQIYRHYFRTRTEPQH